MYHNIKTNYNINNCDNHKTSPSRVEGEAIVDKAICEPEVIPGKCKVTSSTMDNVQLRAADVRR